jgi:fatty-acyl-CoA synthase
LLQVIEREAVSILSLVGNAFGRPFLDALNAAPQPPQSLTTILNSAAAMTPTVKTALIEAVPGLKIVDTFGSSEAGPLAKHVASAGGNTAAAPKTLGESVVLSADMTRLEAPGHSDLGWLATSGAVPLGYLGDAEKTAATFPVIDGVRYAVPGDRARLLTDGEIEFHGRDSSSINTGGEKVFAEEVEQAVGRHVAVADVLVSSRPSERWGEEVVAVVELKPGQAASERDLVEAAGEFIARYKLPKAIKIVEAVKRHDNGKPDYRWAKRVAEGESV